MKMRIVCGKALIQSLDKQNGLKNIIDTGDVLIQADVHSTVINQDKDTAVVMTGNIIGLRDGKFGLTAYSQAGSDIKQLFMVGSVEQCVRLIEGRFAAVRLEKGKVTVFTDRFGQKEIYYRSFKEGYMLATDLDLVQADANNDGFDAIGVAHAMYVYGFRPAKKQTMYKGIKRLGVGEYAVIQNNALTIQQCPLNLPTANSNYGKYELKTYADILLDAVAKRSSDKGNVVFLSSGWDSTTLLACLVKLHGAGKVRAVTGRFNFSKGTGVNNPFEIVRAQAVADYFGVKLEIVEVDYWQRGPELAKQIQPFLRSHMFSGMSLFHWSRICEYLAKTCKGGEALFSGESSDGAHNLGFSQFTTLFHPVHEFREYSDKMSSYLFGPTFLRQIQEGKTESDVIFQLIKNKFKGAVLDKPVEDQVGSTKQLLSSFFLRDNRFPFWSMDNNPMFTPKGRQLYQQQMEKEYVEPLVKQASPDQLYASYLHLYNSFHWQGGTVITLANIAEYYGLQMNLPFYDSRMQEFLSAMPESWGRGLELRPTKYPLKWMLENCIDYPMHLQVGPHSYLYDVDPNFNHAAEFIYRSSFAPFIKECLSKGTYRQLLSPEVFDMAYFDKIVDNYLNGKEVVAERNSLAALTFILMSGVYGANVEALV